MQTAAFTAELRRLWQLSGLSQAELGRRSGVHKVTISRVLGGGYAHVIEQGTLDALAPHLPCTPVERVELYKLAGFVLPELLELFMRDMPESILLMIEVWQIELDSRA